MTTITQAGIDAAIRVTEDKYFGDYELCDHQRTAVEMLVEASSATAKTAAEVAELQLVIFDQKLNYGAAEEEIARLNWTIKTNNELEKSRQDKAAQEIARLRGALKPFAEAADGRRKKDIMGAICFSQELLLEARAALSGSI